jgi:hypothetical protein
MPKPKGTPKTPGSGRKKGTPNKITDSIKNLLNELFPEARLKQLWEYHLKNEVPSTRYRTFEMANHYLFGKPVMPIQGAEDAPPILINVSAIPKRRERAD